MIFLNYTELSGYILYYLPCEISMLHNSIYCELWVNGCYIIYNIIHR